MPTCPSCGGETEEAPSDRASCPRCAGNPPAPADDLMASWLVSADRPVPRPAGDVECRACGYSGEMETVEGLHVCPACLGVQPIPRVAEAPEMARVDGAPDLAQVIDCPNCGRAIEVPGMEAGKTVICPSCKYFLGCVKKRPNRPWWFHRFLRGTGPS